MNWIKRIEESENINQLPLFDELNKIADEEEVDLDWEGQIITIKDDTKIQLDLYTCFADRKNHCFWYTKINADRPLKNQA